MRLLAKPIVCLILSAEFLMGCESPKRDSTAVCAEEPPKFPTIAFKGVPQGGGFLLWLNNNIVAVETRAGEDPAQIAADAAERINANPHLRELNVSAKAQGSELEIRLDEQWVFLCSTDKGLAVPLPPYDLRVTRTSHRLVHLEWKNPPGNYDRINILSGTVPIGGFGGTNTHFDDISTQEGVTYRVFGVKDGMPSCAAFAPVSD